MEALAGIYNYFECLGRLEEALLELSWMLEPKARSLLRWKPEVELKEWNMVTRKRGHAWESAGQVRGYVLSPNVLVT